MGIISDMFQHRMKSIIVLSLSMTVVLLQTGCSFKNNDQASNSIPQKLCDNVVVSAKPDIGTQVTLPTYTAIIGEKSESYINAFFSDSKKITFSELDDGTDIIRSESAKLSTHAAIAMEYYKLDSKNNGEKLFDNYSLFFSVFGAMYDETHIRPSGAHYNYIPDALNSTDDLQFQTIEETKRAVDKQMQRFDGYNFTAYRTEVITNEALQKIYKSQNLKESSINAGLTITDDWLESASGYRFFYSMNIESYPIYRDSQILKVKTTSEGNPIICPETELFVTKDGLIYVYMKSPISDFQRSNKNVTVINASIACESIATYFENLILSSDNSVDIYKIQLEYAACRQNESIELKPVYALYYTQGGNIGCLLVNAQNGKLL